MYPNKHAAAEQGQLCAQRMVMWDDPPCCCGQHTQGCITSAYVSWTPNTAFWAGSSIFEAARAASAQGAGITGGDHCHLEKYHISWSMLCPGPAPNRRVGSNCYRGSRHHRGSNGAAAATAASPANNRTGRHACYQAAWTAAPLHAATKVLHVCSFTCKNECSLHSVLAKKEQPQHTTESLVPISGTDNWALSGCRTRSHTL